MYKPVATWNTEDVVAWIRGEFHIQQYYMVRSAAVKQGTLLALCTSIILSIEHTSSFSF